MSKKKDVHIQRTKVRVQRIIDDVFQELPEGFSVYH